MKNFKLKRLLSLAFIGCLSTLNATTVFAAAGDTISNTASLGYSVGGVAQVAATGSVDFVEDNLVNFSVTWVDAPNVNVAAGAAGQMLTFLVTNNGNGPQDFDLTAINALIADGFDVTPASIVIAVDEPVTGTPGAYDAGDIDTFVDELAVLGTRQVYVFADIPTPLAAALLANVTLTATVHADGVADVLGAILADDSANPDIETGAGAEQVVFNDPAGIAPDVVQDGLHSVNGIYEIVAANLTVSKAMVALWDPYNLAVNPKSVPGALVQYTITVANGAGGASATLTTLSDALQAAAGSLSFDTVLVINDGATAESALGNVRIDTTAGGVGAGTGRAAVAAGYCVAEAADANADGCTYTIGTRTLGLVFSDLVTPANPNIAGLAAEAGYTEGELKAGESIDIVFNAYVD